MCLLIVKPDTYLVAREKRNKAASHWWNGRWKRGRNSLEYQKKRTRGANLSTIVKIRLLFTGLPSTSVDQVGPTMQARHAIIQPMVHTAVQFCLKATPSICKNSLLRLYLKGKLCKTPIIIFCCDSETTERIWNIGSALDDVSEGINHTLQRAALI